MRRSRFMVILFMVSIKCACLADNQPSAGVTFSKSLVTVGVGSNWSSEKAGYPDASTKPHRLTATIAPLSLANSITFSSDNTSVATVSEVSRTDGENYQVVILEVTGVSKSSSAAGDVKIEAKNGVKVVKDVKVVVIVPATSSHSVGNATYKNTATLKVGGGTTLTSRWEQMVTITIKDQFGNALGGIYNGANVVQEKFDNINGVSSAWPSPGTWVNIRYPDNVLMNGIKRDQNNTVVTAVNSSTMSLQQRTEWIAGIYYINGGNNLFKAQNIAWSSSADMSLKVAGHVLTTIHVRKKVSKAVNYPTVPGSVSDSIKQTTE